MKNKIHLVSIVLLVLMISNICHSQTYKKVTSSEHYNSTEKGKFENVYVFEFNPSATDYFDFKNCAISFYAIDQAGDPLPEGHTVRAITGYKHNYTEDEVTSNPSGLTNLNITTNNLGDLLIVVCFNGPDRTISLHNVEFSYTGEKYK